VTAGLQHQQVNEWRKLSISGPTFRGHQWHTNSSRYFIVDWGPSSRIVLARNLIDMKDSVTHLCREKGLLPVLPEGAATHKWKLIRPDFHQLGRWILISAWNKYDRQPCHYCYQIVPQQQRRRWHPINPPSIEWHPQSCSHNQCTEQISCFTQSNNKLDKVEEKDLTMVQLNEKF
jgi:hypothetical protein